jgi:hypothetical protein
MVDDRTAAAKSETYGDRATQSPHNRQNRYFKQQGVRRQKM